MSARHERSRPRTGTRTAASPARPPDQDRELREDDEGYMGNWGNTAERWYHRAAVVQWPRSKLFVIRAEVSPAWAVAQTSKALRGRSPDRARERVRAVAPFWNHSASREAGKPFFSKTLRVASGLENRDLAASLLAPFRRGQLGAHAVPVVCRDNRCSRLVLNGTPGAGSVRPRTSITTVAACRNPAAERGDGATLTGA